MSLLSIEGLDIDLAASGRRLVRDVTFNVEPGRIVGIVGESGSGKSMIAHGLMGLLPTGIQVRGGAIGVAGSQVLDAEGNYVPSSRSHLALISQNPRAALNPTMRVGRQIERVLVQRRGMNRSEAVVESRRLLRAVGITDTERAERAYPHQMSGGMCQRIVIAIALAVQPSVLIADEPTTGLDVTIQAQILLLLRELVAGTDRSILLVTHDLRVVSSLCDDVVVLYGGQIMERGKTADVFRAPRHPYTRYLLGSVRDAGRDPIASRVSEVPVDFTLQGCRFASRCPLATEVCWTTAPPVVQTSASAAMCHHLEEK